MTVADKPIAAASRYVNVGGIRTHYFDGGDGAAVVLLHSGEFGASAELCWESSIDVLAQHFRVVAPDWLGFGLTDKIHDFVSGTDRMIRHMAAFLEVLDVEEADFVGASMGATLLLREAAGAGCRFPIRNLVTVSGGGFVVDNAARRTTLAYDGTTESMRRVVAALVADERWAADDAYIERRVASANAPGAWEAIASARFKSPVRELRTALGAPDTIEYESITARTLAFAGGRDRLREPGYHEVLHRIPDSRVVVFPQAGHLLNIEAANDFNELMIRFLQGDDLDDVADEA